jgi:FkbM family methyltransferase
MIIKNNKTIFSSFVRENNLKFNYIDIGARGDIESPWCELESDSLILGFEPDSNETKRLNKTFPDRKYFDMALWGKKCSKKVYINEWESTSSMYEANYNFITDFQKQHWGGRKTKMVVDVNCDTLDTVFSKEKIIPDFIKIDTQGAELEILKGAEVLLKNHHPMVTCETWCAEVYKDAPMMHQIITYMDSLDYQVFDMELAAAWKHGSKEIYSKRKSIGYEILFVKNNIKHDNEATLTKFLLLLELYGYRDYALYWLSKLEIKNKDFLFNVMNQNSINDAKFFTRLENKIKRYFGYNMYPNIKY